MSEQAKNRQNPEEIEQDIQQTRSEMDRTLSDLEDSLSPGKLLDRALQDLKQGGGSSYLRSLQGSIRQNPLPIAITAVGLAWMMWSSRPESSDKAGQPAGRSRQAVAPGYTPVPVTQPATEEPVVTPGMAEHGTASIDYGKQQAQVDPHPR